MVRKVEQPRDAAEALLLLSERVKHSAGAPNIHMYGPHIKQNIFHSFGRTKLIRQVDLNLDAIKDKSSLIKIRLYIGGNRSGKTVGGIIEDIWWLSKTHPYIDIDAIWPEPIRGRLVTVDFVTGWEQIIQPVLRQWCPLSYLKGGSWITAWDKETHTLEFANGSTLEIKSADSQLDKFAGTSRHFVHFDEEPPEDIYKESMARLIDTGGCAWFTMTPVEGMTWVFEEIYEKGQDPERKDIQTIEVAMDENPYLAVEERDAYLALLGKEDAEARRYGRFIRRGGLVYKNFSEEIHVVEYSLPNPDYLWVASLDHGWNNPTAWLWHAVNYEGRIVTFFEHYASGMVIREHAAKYFEICKHLGRLPDYNVGDPAIRQTSGTTGTSIFEEYVKYGIPIICDTPGLNDVRAGLVRVGAYLTPQADEFGNESPYWHVTDNCTNLIWEMKRYRWKVYKRREVERDNNNSEEPHKKDDHACDSLRYFIMSRPDLRASVPSDLRTVRNPQGTAAVYSSGSLDKRANTPAAYTNLTPVDVKWNKDYYNGSTEWTPDEHMGAEW